MRAQTIRAMPDRVPSRRARLATLVAPALVAALALGGCGEPAAVHMPGRVLRLQLDEYRILPATVSVTAGTVRIVATNRGRLTHNVVIQSGKAGRGGRRHTYGATRTAFPGETVTGVAVLRPGRYRMISSIGNQKDLGQWGTVIAHAPR